MDYVQILFIVFFVLFGLISLATFHFLFFSIVGIFACKRFPKAKVQHKYGIIMAARNEEAVIGNLIKSIQKNDYPRDKLQIFVVAHNCTDGTAKISRDNGATVYEYNNPKELTKGYALKYLFECIQRDYGIESFDGYICLDADNILSKNYIDKLNDAFDAGNCENIITSFRNSKNFDNNLISGLYGLFFINNCRLESRGRTVCGCSTRIQGTGFLISSKHVKNGWNYVTLTEDWEFTADQILQGNKIVYCDEAVFYDEQPTTIKIMLRQRLRWARGHLLVFLSRGKALIKSLFPSKKKEGKKKNGFSRYDIFINCLPICVITGVLSIVNFILLNTAPLVDKSIDIYQHYLNLYIEMGIGLAIAYVLFMLDAIVIFILENKRISKKVNIFKRIGMTLLWPIFIFIAIPLEFIAIFTKNVPWKAIPHNDKNDFESLNGSAGSEAIPVLSANREEAATSLSPVTEATKAIADIPAGVCVASDAPLSEPSEVKINSQDDVALVLERTTKDPKVDQNQTEDNCA